MSKKKRSPHKTPAKSISRKSSSKDLVTGLFMTSPPSVAQERQLVQSDKVYSVTQKEVDGLPSGYWGYGKIIPGTFPLQYEFELTRDFLVGTVVQASGAKYRIAAQGEFGFSSGQLISAKVFGYANRFWIPEADGTVFESGFSAAIDGQSIGNPDRIELWFQPPFFSSSTSSFTQINSVLTDDQGKTVVTAFGGGRFFADGWESSPFASNLL